LTPKLKQLIDNFWKIKENRRSFFETVAREQEKDPLLVSTWSEIHVTPLLKVGGFFIFLFIILMDEFQKGLKYYNGSLSKALQDLFPEINLNLKC
jgi:hypothetical protein